VTAVRPARDDAEVHAALALRHTVFCEEQGVSVEEEHDGRDDEALHLVAVREGAVIATCRLLVEGPTVKLGRMAVARPERGQGLAAALLAEADAHARDLGAQRIVLGAQLTARRVYERAGYVAFGEHFIEAGIEHVMMAKALG
jgi:predicted GNAT family N-acyltransferase